MKYLLLLLLLCFVSGDQWDPCGESPLYMFESGVSEYLGHKLCMSQSSQNLIIIDNCNETDPFQLWQHVNGTLKNAAGYYVHRFFWPRTKKAGSRHYMLRCDSQLQDMDEPGRRTCAHVVSAQKGAGQYLAYYYCFPEPVPFYQSWKKLQVCLSALDTSMLDTPRFNGSHSSSHFGKAIVDSRIVSEL